MSLLRMRWNPLATLKTPVVIAAAIAVVIASLAGAFLLHSTTAHAESSACAGDTGTSALTGTIGGAKYKIEVPANWNGTLFLYSHGYVFPGSAVVATDAGDPLTGGALLQQGYALAGSSYSSQGWALQQAFHDQIALLDYFDATCGQPARTIAWGHSLGGIITAGLAQLYPDRFTAALPMCGVLARGVGTWNQALDGAFAFDVLLANNALPIAHFNPVQVGTDFNQAEGILAAAQQTPQGRARLALSAALGDTPGWFTSLSDEPASTDYASQELNQYKWDSQVDFAFIFFARAELEARAGGNPSWNTGVEYSAQLAHSADAQEVRALYSQAGLDLDQDLATLNAAPRIAADANAVAYLNQYITFDGDLDMPVLSMHTTGDGLVVPEDEHSYLQVSRPDAEHMLRQVFVHRAGHCAFTPAETLQAVSTLLHRVDTGRWDDTTDPATMNAGAAALGSAYNVFSSGNTLVATPPAFLAYRPATFLRPYTDPSRGSAG